MSDLQLSLICSDNDRTRPVIDGVVKPDGIDWSITVAHPSEIFWRQLHHAEFDVSEMSMSSLLMAVAHGDDRWVGIPCFTSRRFFHTGVLVRTDRGINSPEDLKGKKVGVPEYQMTAALWTRAALFQLYGLKAQDFDWYMERNPEMSHGGATGFDPANSGVKLQYIPPETNLGEYMQKGTVDAALLYLAGGNLVDRSTADLTKDPNVRRLFPDGRAEGVKYHEKTGFYPMNHGMVIKRSVYEKYPWVAVNVFNAMSKAKDMVNVRARELAAPFVELGVINAAQAKVIAGDPFPYGVQANRQILESVAQFSHDQGLTPRVLKLEEVFAPSTMEL